MIVLEFPSYLSLSVSCLSYYTLADVIIKLGKIISEYVYFKDHYKKDESILKRSLYKSPIGYVILVANTIMVLKLDLVPLLWENWPLFVAILLCRLSYKYIESNHFYADFIRKESGIDYGSGMANNYFHGYFKIIVPSTGHNDGIEDIIEVFETAQKIKIPIKKYFVLVPKMLRHKQQKFEDDWIEIADGCVEQLKIYRAGASRPYTIPIYRFKNKILNEQCYILVEFATPLLSFYEALRDSETSSKMMHDMKFEISKSFVNSLRRYLSSDPSTMDKVEIVEFDENEYCIGEALHMKVESMMKEERKKK